MTGKEPVGLPQFFPIFKLCLFASKIVFPDLPQKSNETSYLFFSSFSNF